VNQLGEELRAERSTTQILQGQLKESTARIFRLQTDLTFAQEHAMSEHEVAAFKRDCEEAAMEAAMEAARGDIERSRKTRDEALTAADQLSAKLRKLEGATSGQASTASMKKEMAAMYEDMQVLVDQRDALRQKLTDAESDTLNAKNSRASSEELEAAKAKAARLEDELSRQGDAQDELASYRKKLAAAEDRARQLQDKLDTEKRASAALMEAQNRAKALAEQADAQQRAADREAAAEAARKKRAQDDERERAERDAKAILSVCCFLFCFVVHDLCTAPIQRM